MTQTAAMTLNLKAIAAALEELQGALPTLRPYLSSQPEYTIDATVFRRLLSGYAFLQELQDQQIELLDEPGFSKLILELNHRVLYGLSDLTREHHGRALEHSEQRFYEDSQVDVGGLMEWYAMHRGLPPFERAAGVYVWLLSEPELFVEGNHRTGCLLASHVLLCERLPPVVARPAMMATWFDISSDIERTRRRGFFMRRRARRLRQHLATLFESNSHPDFLMPPAASRSAARALSHVGS